MRHDRRTCLGVRHRYGLLDSGNYFIRNRCIMENYLVKAIKKLRPNSEFSFTDNDYSTISYDYDSRFYNLYFYNLVFIENIFSSVLRSSPKTLLTLLWS